MISRVETLKEIGSIDAYKDSNGDLYGFLGVPLGDDIDCEEERDDEPSADDLERDFMNEHGCLFPNKCCMPYPHLRSECHTASMLEEFNDEMQRCPRCNGKAEPPADQGCIWCDFTGTRSGFDNMERMGRGAMLESIQDTMVDGEECPY